MQIIGLTLGAFDTNVYIVASDQNKEAAVIDPASKAETILDVITKLGYKLTKILLTHGHYDHCAACFDLKETTGAKVYLHEADAPMLTDADKSVAALMPEEYKPFEVDVFMKDGDVITFGEVELTVKSAPGHTAGSVMFFCKDLSGKETTLIFSGDTLFEGSAGRTDLWSGDFEAQKRTMREISEIGGDYRILTGHGSHTTLKKEKATNLFLYS